MPFPPAFDIKYVTQQDVAQSEIETGDVDYLGDWDGENFPPQEYYFNIEWIKVRPRYLKNRDKLITPEVVDGSKVFAVLCVVEYREISRVQWCERSSYQDNVGLCLQGKGRYPQTFGGEFRISIFS